MNNLVWITSYPKSGNTWARIFLANLLSGSEEPVTINKVNVGTIIAYRKLFEDLTGVRSELFKPQEINRIRLQALSTLANDTHDLRFFKVHDQYLCPFSHNPIVPSNDTFKAIYIVRNPLDVTVSFAKYYNKSYDETIGSMQDKHFCLAPIRIEKGRQFQQHLGHWSDHVAGWETIKDFSVKVIRYEDLLNNPEKEFGNLVGFLDLKRLEKRIPLAIKHSEFENLKKQENEGAGFFGNPSASTSFFRNGKAGGWKTELSEQQVNRIRSNHNKVMKQFGYGEA